MDDLDVLLVYSHLRNIKQCPYLYYLLQIKKVHLPHDNRRFIKPDAIDAGATDWIRAGMAEGKLVEFCLSRYDDYAKRWRWTKWKSNTDKKECRDEVENGAKLLERAFVEADLMHGEVEPQPQFDITLPGKPYRARGKLDLWDRKYNRVFDIKFTESKQWLDMTQLVFYDMCWSVQIRSKVTKTGYLTPLMKEIVQEQDATQDKWDEVIALINKSVQEYMTKNFYPANGISTGACYMCLAKGICDMYSVRPVTTKSARGQKISL